MAKNVEIPEMQKIAPAKDFKVFTQTKNKLVKDLKVEQSNESIIEYMRENVSAALSEFMDIIFDQAGLEAKINESTDLKFLSTIDFTRVRLSTL